MNSSIRIRANLRQIIALQAEKARIADGWLSIGLQKATEACEAISDQIIALYEEIDSIEAGEVSQAGRIENATGRDDEFSVTPLELELAKDLGWGREEIIKDKMRRARGKAGRCQYAMRRLD